MPGKGVNFVNEEIVTESVIRLLVDNLNPNNEKVWNDADAMLMAEGFAVPSEPFPKVTADNFFRFDMKAKFDAGQNLFIVGAKIATIEGVDRGKVKNNYDLQIVYVNSRLIDENKMKRDYFAFRIRDAVIATMAVSERLRITNRFAPKVQLQNIDLTQDEGFALNYNLA